MEWTEYIDYLLSSTKEFENITISLDEGHTVTTIPPIISASILMLDKMVEHQGKRNILVFPEKVQSIFIFTLIKLFHNIASGKIQSNYDPTGFIVGEKLKVGNAIVEYLGYEERDNKTCLKIKLADLDSLSTPIEHMPIFQKVSTNRRLSKSAQFAQARKEALALLKDDTTGNQKLSHIAEMRTHMDSSIFTMTSVANVKEQINKCRIGGKKITDVFYIAQADYEGNITNISSGQMTGVPAIVFSSNLYAINAAITNNQVQSIIIDGSNMNVLIGQLDALDELLHTDVPIVCITDVVNSFDLDQLETRGFNIWRWNKDSISEHLYDAVPILSDKKAKNCVRQNVCYLYSKGEEISSSIQVLSKHRRETELQSSQVMKLFEKLNTLTFSALRMIVQPSEMENNLAQRTLDECDLLLAEERSFLDDNTVSDYSNVIAHLRKVYTKDYKYKKVTMLEDYIQSHRARTVYVVVPERANKNQIQNYWEMWRLRTHGIPRIKVLFPAEYYSWPMADSDVTIIVGWFKRAIMRKIIFSYNTDRYVVLLYDYEDRWKRYDHLRWQKSLNHSSNKAIIENAFSSNSIQVSTKRFNQDTDEQKGDALIDELSEIELILRENKFRQYASSGARRGSEPVPAIPVTFIGSLLAFYKTSHKIISATKIITADSDKIEIKLPNDLRIGDFIVVRETDRDLVRELADVILANSNKSNLRELAGKWREALKIELLFASVDQLYGKLKAAGCDKEYATVRRWIEDEDVIAPQSKEDLRVLASVTENESLQEMADDIFDAAQEVRKAHIVAGRKLSEELRKTLAKELKAHEDIDPFNIWEPIDMEVEGIGNVKVLKIIDIGTVINVDAADTNRLIEE